MTDTQINAQELLDQLLNAGRELAKQGQERTKGLSKKGREIAVKGENYLVDKLGLDDSEISRNSLRKGVGAGAAAGALALLLSSRSGRKIVTIGGLAGLGALAWKSYQKNGGKMPKSAQEIIGLLKGPKAEIRSEILLRAMIAAAKADGQIGEEELHLINAHNRESAEVLRIALAAPESPVTIADLANSEQEGREIYAVSCRVANGLNPAERDYLDELAMALGLDPELAARLETDVRTG
ncbi:MAG: DUF533 domain-containing protein [Robiginitomaculum sp.]|nr:DUF533 domain-containing protein [Robiginitomaculum sp.]